MMTSQNIINPMLEILAPIAIKMSARMTQMYHAPKKIEEICTYKRYQDQTKNA